MVSDSVRTIFTEALLEFWHMYSVCTRVFFGPGNEARYLSTRSYTGYVAFTDLMQLKRASLVDSRTEVNDVKFAPKHLGLQLVREHTLLITYRYQFLCV